MNYSYILLLDNAVTLLRLKQLDHKLTNPERVKLDLAIDQAIKAIDSPDYHASKFDTAAAYKQFFGRDL